MKITKENAQKLWRERYGSAYFVKDYHGNLMCYDDYGDSNRMRYLNGRYVSSGWNIHHILPVSKGGSNAKGNLACTNITTNQKASNKITYWMDNKKYQVKKTGSGYNVVRLD